MSAEQIDPLAAAATEYDHSAAASPDAAEPQEAAPQQPRPAAQADTEAADSDADGQDGDQASAGQGQESEPASEAKGATEEDQRFAARMQEQVAVVARSHQAQLEQRHGEQLPEVIRAANRTLQRFAPPELRAMLRDNPGLHAPDFIALLAAVDRFAIEHDKFVRAHGAARANRVPFEAADPSDRMHNANQAQYAEEVRAERAAEARRTNTRAQADRPRPVRHLGGEDAERPRPLRAANAEEEVAREYNRSARHG